MSCAALNDKRRSNPSAIPLGVACRNIEHRTGKRKFSLVATHCHDTDKEKLSSTQIYDEKNELQAKVMNLNSEWQTGKNVNV